MKCPLCLKTLGLTDKILRFCSKHPDATELLTLDGDVHSKLFCQPKDGSACKVSSVQDAPILVHDGCGSLSPFQKGHTFDIESRVHYGDKQIHSWQLDVPRMMPLEYRSQAMWFPLSLFLAVNELPERKRSATVLLLGEQAAGKSVLATMAIRAATWAGETYGYVYVSPPERSGAANQIRDENGERLSHRDVYLKYLAATVLDAGFDLGPTAPRDVNIRAVFLSPSAKPATVSEASNHHDQNPVGFWEGVKQLVRAAWEFISPKDRISLTESDRAVVFYDIPGEQVQPEVDRQILHLSEHYDRCAIVLDVEKLSFLQSGLNPEAKGTGPRDSLKKLKEMARQGKDVCLVLTKLDKLRNRTPGAADSATDSLVPHFSLFKEHLNGPNIKQYKPTVPQFEKNVLLELLSQCTIESEQQLKEFLTSHADCPVFFVWTEDLNLPNPYSVGMHDFVKKWCLPQNS